MRFFGYMQFFLIILFATSFAQEIPAPSCPVILNYIDKNLPNYGILKRSNGFVYVDLDDEYVHALITFIQQDGFQEPPYFGDAGLVGAHITVMYPEETAKYGIKDMKECGEMVFFVPKKCQVVHPPRWKEIDEVYFIVVDAPQLDKIREKYGLPKQEYDFHITIGVKPKMVKSFPLFRNVLGSSPSSIRCSARKGS